MRYLEVAVASQWAGGVSEAWVGERDTIGVGGVN